VPSEGRTALVFAGAPILPTQRLQQRIAGLENPLVIAADSGARNALAFGLRPDVVVGDLDSLDPDTRRQLEHDGVPFERFPRAKDATDGQLALARALVEQPTSVLLLGFLNGPRLDMTLASALLLATTDVHVELLDEGNACVLLKGPDEHAWTVEADELISLLPLGGDCLGVATRGLRYPLDHERLAFGQTRGVSNEPLETEVSVSLDTGLLLLTRHFPGL
jgi:thiamine pyrophosphokinase